jgi:phosphatidate cytidylyltransferase
MAFNWQTFKTRTLTSLIFVVVMLAGLLWDRWSFLVLFSIIHFGCWWEYLKLTEKIHKTTFHVYTKLGFMVMGYGLMLWFCAPAIYHINDYSLKGNLSLPASAAGFALLLIGIFQKNAINQKGFIMAMFGFVYISLCWGLMIDLQMQGVSIWCGNGGGIAGLSTSQQFFLFPFVIIPLCTIVALWINDTMAYLVGSFIGKTPLSKISPKKTWEGTLGGIVLAIFITGFIFSNIDSSVVIPWFKYNDFLSGSVWYLIAGIAAIAGTFGDLFESWLKRTANVKDSGSLMPGHGGFLDRFDSLLLATPAVWIYLYLLSNT